MRSQLAYFVILLVEGTHSNLTPSCGFKIECHIADKVGVDSLGFFFRYVIGRRSITPVTSTSSWSSYTIGLIAFVANGYIPA